MIILFLDYSIQLHISIIVFNIVIEVMVDFPFSLSYITHFTLAATELETSTGTCGAH